MYALDDIVVLDLTHHIAGPYATKLLADFGADVIKVEPPWGDIARRLPPFQGDDPHPEKSGLFFLLNTNKRSVVLDLRTNAGRARLAELALAADLVVENFAPGTLDRLGVSREFFQRLKPSLPLVSISNFGQDGPYRDYKASDLVLYGFAGEMYSIGDTGREPVKMYGTAALIESGSAAAVAALAAVEAARRSGVGQHIDISLAETHFGGVDRRHATAIAYQFSGRKTVRAAGTAPGMPSGIYPCADGYVDFTNSGGRDPGRVAAMIDQPWARQPLYLDRLARLDPEIVEEWNAQFIPWCLERTKRGIWAEARRARIMCGPLFSMEDLFTDEHFRGRGFWQPVEHAVMGTVEIPGRPFIMPRGGWSVRRAAPLLGEHSGDPLPHRRPLPAVATAPAARGSAARPVGSVAPAPAGGAGQRPPGQATAATPAAATHARPPLPLAGVRVVDLCVVWAGPFATMLLGDLGAEVIKAENPYVFQPGTRGGMARPPQRMLDAGSAWGSGFPGNVPGPRPWNYSPTFVSVYRNKKSFTVDLRRPEGLEVLRRLVARSDVVYENNATDTLEKLGITYEWLRQAREDIIVVRAPAYGSTGPYIYGRALGVHLEGVMGHTLLRGYEDTDPTENTAIYSGDYMAGAQGAFAVLAALHHRRRSGEGQLIELAQAENASAMFAQALMDFSLNRREQRPAGNRDIFGWFPCGVYPCLPAPSYDPASGALPALTCDDRWVSIHVQSDADWIALKQAMGAPTWADDDRYATNAGRAAAAATIDRQIGAWTATLDDYEVMRRCQAAGVAAMPVLEASRMFDDPQLRARDFFRRQRIEHAGEHQYVGPLWRFSDTPVEFSQPPVMFGEHNDYVYRDVLGMSDDEIEHLRAAGHISMDYDASVP